jgi:hypothetical protein
LISRARSQMAGVTMQSNPRQNNFPRRMDRDTEPARFSARVRSAPRSAIECVYLQDARAAGRGTRGDELKAESPVELP